MSAGDVLNIHRSVDSRQTWSLAIKDDDHLSGDGGIQSENTLANFLQDDAHNKLSTFLQDDAKADSNTLVSLYESSFFGSSDYFDEGDSNSESSVWFRDTQQDEKNKPLAEENPSGGEEDDESTSEDEEDYFGENELDDPSESSSEDFYIGAAEAIVQTSFFNVLSQGDRRGFSSSKMTFKILSMFSSVNLILNRKF